MSRLFAKHFYLCVVFALIFVACSKDDDPVEPVYDVVFTESIPDGYTIESRSIKFLKASNNLELTFTSTQGVKVPLGTYNVEATAVAKGYENGSSVQRTLRAVAQNVAITQLAHNVTLAWAVYNEPSTGPVFTPSGYYLKNDIRDLVLIYQGGIQRMDFNLEQIRPYVVHINRHGVRDWLFDGFLFCEFDSGRGVTFETQNGKTPSVKADWEWLIDRHFEKGKAIHALDQCIGEEIARIGKPSFKHKIVISMPDPQYGQTDWGELNGKKIDFNNDADRIAACKWYVDKLRERFAAANFQNIEIAGFYWMPEKSLNSRNVTIAMGEYVRSLGKQFYWIPYFASVGFSEWRQLGFDAAYIQPTFFWDRNVADSRLDRVCELAYSHHMGVEMEFDMAASVDFADCKRDRGIKYMSAFRRHGIYRESSIAYYEGGAGMYNFTKKTDIRDREFIDTLAWFIQERRRRMVEGKNPDFTTEFESSSLDKTDWNVSGIVQCENGSLVMKGKAAVDTRRKHDFMYGTVKARVKILPGITGATFTVRLLPTNEKLGALPKSGELFLLKYDSSRPDELYCGSQTMQNCDNLGNPRRSILIDDNITGRWIELECKWTEKDVIFTVDGRVINVQEDLYDSSLPYYPQGWPFNHDTFYLQIETSETLSKPVAEIDYVSVLPD